MNLVEIHNVNKNSVNYVRCVELCYLSKNLYNQALYEFNKRYKEDLHFLRYNEMEKILKKMPDEFNNYNKLTASVSQQVLMLFDKNVKSYLGLIKLWKKDKSKLNGCPKFLKYKDKINGKNTVIIRGDKHVCKYKDGYIHFPKKLQLKPIKTINVLKQDDLVQVRIIPNTSCYKIEIVYKKEEKILKVNNNKCSIDLGVNNLATLTFNNKKAIIINGKDIKSINKYYNKQKAKIQSKLILNENKYTSKELNRFTDKRNNKIKDLLHKKSRIIVDQLEKNEVSEIVIGYNKEWKNGIKLGKKNNQTFVSIPYNKFIDMLKYKCSLVGINVLINEESYTSKCSSLDLESICRHENYVGKRIKRGLFKTGKGLLINADINGSLNIGRKVFGDVFIPTDIGFVINPSRI